MIFRLPPAMRGAEKFTLCISAPPTADATVQKYEFYSAPAFRPQASSRKTNANSFFSSKPTSGILAADYADFADQDGANKLFHTPP